MSIFFVRLKDKIEYLYQNLSGNFEVFTVNLRGGGGGMPPKKSSRGAIATKNKVDLNSFYCCFSFKYITRSSVG